MIANPSIRANLQAEWQGVVRMRDRVQHLLICTSTSDADQSPAFGNILYNLPVLLAFDVLRQVLLQAQEEEHIAESRYRLSDLLDSARNDLDWIDWQFLREGVRQKDETVFGSQLFGDSKCLHYLAIIEAQLVVWGIITAAEPCFPRMFPRFT